MLHVDIRKIILLVEIGKNCLSKQKGDKEVGVKRIVDETVPLYFLSATYVVV